MHHGSIRDFALAAALGCVSVGLRVQLQPRIEALGYEHQAERGTALAQVVTVMNMKGGVGKTTVTLHLAGMLATYNLGDKRRPLRVLAIDYDPQFNLSQAFLPTKTYFALEKQSKTTLAVLVDSGTALNPYQIQVPGNHTPPSIKTLATRIFQGKIGCLDLVPSTLDLMYIALGQANSNMSPIEERFEKLITECRGIYDLILIDCHPAGSLFTKTSLMNSDHVLIPVVPQKYAIRGIGLMFEFMKAKKVNAKVPDPIILFNSTTRTGVSGEEMAIRKDPKYAEYCLASTLKWYKAFTEPEEGNGFVWQSNKPYSTTAFQNLFAVARDFKDWIGF